MSNKENPSQIPSFQETPISINTSKRKRKEYSKTSIVYKHSIKIGQANNAFRKCNYCSITYSDKSTTNMKKHLKFEHDIKDDDPQDSEFNDSDSDEAPAKKTKKASKATSTSRSEKLLLEFIVSAALRFRIVENVYFIKFVESLSQSFNMPSRYILSTKLLNGEFQEIVNSVTLELSQAESVAVTLNGWTSVQLYPYLGVTVHFFDCNLRLCNRTLTISHLPGSHTGENISEALYKTLEEWNILDNVLGVCADNARNMKNIAKNVVELIKKKQSKVRNIYQIGCVAHIINLIVKKINKYTKQVSTESEKGEEDEEMVNVNLDEVETNIVKNFKTLIEKCRKIASLFHQSTQVSEILGEKQTFANVDNHKIMQDVQTRWNSTFLMLERFQEQVDMVNETLCDRRLNNKNEQLKFTADDKILLNEAVDILQPFYDATVEISKVKYPTISVVIPIFQGLLNVLEMNENDSIFTLVFKKILSHYTEHYIQKYKIFDNNLFITATYLDVRTKLFVRCTETKKNEYVNIAKSTIRSIVDEFPDELKQALKIELNQNKTKNSQLNTQQQSNQSVTNNPNRLQIFDFNKGFESKKNYIKLNTLEKELYRYYLEPCKDIDPIEFWRSNKENFLILYHVFLRVFSIPATSVPAEQLFSAAANSIWDRRNKISPENVNKVMVIYENLPEH